MKEYKVVIGFYEEMAKPTLNTDKDSSLMRVPDEDGNDAELEKVRKSSNVIETFTSYLKAREFVSLERERYATGSLRVLEIEEYQDGQLVAIEPVEDDPFYHVCLVERDENGDKRTSLLKIFSDEADATKFAKEKVEKYKEEKDKWITIHLCTPIGKTKHIQTIRIEDEILVDIVPDIIMPRKINLNGSAAQIQHERNQQVTLNAYKWLLDNGILQKVAFEFRKVDDYYDFAVDVKELLPYREQIETSGVDDIELFTRRLFDTYWSKCRYSGAFQMINPMRTYRDNDGCVGSSWEIEMVSNLSTKTANEIVKIRIDNGTKDAIKELYRKYYEK